MKTLEELIGTGYGTKKRAMQALKIIKSFGIKGSVDKKIGKRYWRIIVD